MLGGPVEAWPDFRAFVIARWPDIAAQMLTRATQTNEVGRVAPVLTGLVAVHRLVRRPLAIIEIGASAGLNLRPDRYAYDFVSPSTPSDVTRSPV